MVPPNPKVVPSLVDFYAPYPVPIQRVSKQIAKSIKAKAL